MSSILFLEKILIFVETQQETNQKRGKKGFFVMESELVSQLDKNNEKSLSLQTNV